MPGMDAGTRPITRFEAAFKRSQEGVSSIRKSLGLPLLKEKLQEGSSLPERTIKGQAVSHIKDMEVLADDLTNLSGDVQSMRKDLLASPGPGTEIPA